MTEAITPDDIEQAFADVKKGMRNSPTHCRVGTLLAENPTLAGKVMDQDYSANTVSMVLKRLGFPPCSPTLIRQHRRDECRCPKETP